MRVLQKIALSISLVTAITCSLIVIHPSPVYAANCPGGKARLLTFPAWYNGVVDDSCNIKMDTGEDGLRNFIIKIALNIIEMILQLASYSCIVFIMVGGFRYMTNNGDPSGLTAARITITNAVIGLVISFASVVIVNSVAGVL